MKPLTTLLRSRKLPTTQSGTRLALTPRRAGWEYVGFAVRQIAAGQTWTGRSGGDELCLVLLGGLA
jgi:5-deoxy-glucuronate isomerase